MLDRILNFIETYICAFLFAVMCIFIMLQILFRALGLPLAWTEEFARYLFVWVIYIASSKAIHDNRHLSVDIIPLVLKEKGNAILMIFTNIACFIFFAVLLKYGTEVLMRLQVNTQFSPAAGINMIIPYAAPVFGSVMMLTRCIENIVKEIHVIKKKEIGMEYNNE